MPRLVSKFLTNLCDSMPQTKCCAGHFLVDLEANINSRVATGWDGQVIPGTSIERLQRINRIHASVEVK